MQDVFIVGAGGWGREVLAQARTEPDSDVKWQIKGFLDSRPNLHDGKNIGIPILGDPMTHQVQADALYICAIGDPYARQKYIQPLRVQKAKFLTLRSHALLSPRNHIDLGTIICHRTQISPDVYLGQFVNIHSNTIISHDVKVGNFVQIGAMVFIGGNVEINNFVTIHPGAIILPGIKIGEGATIGAGSVVIKNVPSGSTVFGNPARPVFSKNTLNNPIIQ